MAHRFSFLLTATLTLACGGSREPAAAPEPSAAPTASEPTTAASASAPPAEGEADAQAHGLPTECASPGGEVCAPPRQFVEKLCQDVYPNVALVMFRQGTPWTRAYLTRKTEAWNASGGASVSGWLEFDEEVIVLKHRAAPKGGMQVSGAGGGYEALRWNGACVTLAAEEVTLRRPPKPKYAKVEWKWLEPDMRDALKENEKVNDAYVTWRKECKGVTMGTVSKTCVTADTKLADLIVSFVSSGGAVAEPTKLPE
jgi:hypothetical protein